MRNTITHRQYPATIKDQAPLRLYISTASRSRREERLVREAIHFTKGRYEDKIAEGTKFRQDHGSPFISHAF